MGPDKFQNITAILFDLDNTLIHTKAADRIACEHVFRSLLVDGVRKSIAREAVDKFRDSLSETPSDSCVDTWRLLQFRRALGPGLSAKAPALAALWKDIRTKALRAAPGLEDLLLSLRSRYKLAMISCGPPGPAWEMIERMGLSGSGLFDALVVGGEGAALFEEAFRKLDVSAMECAFVCEDLRLSARAQCGATVWLSPEGVSELREPRVCIPDFVIRDLRQLPDLLPERRGFASLCQDRMLGFFHSLREEGWTTESTGAQANKSSYF